MNSDLSVFTIASAMARHAATRHRVLAENVANADTPGYRARDIDPFDAETVDRLQRDSEGRSLMLQRMLEARELENANTSPDGNSVSVDDQLARAVDAQAQHNTALAIYRKSMELLRLSFTQR